MNRNDPYIYIYITNVKLWLMFSLLLVSVAEPRGRRWWRPTFCLCPKSLPVYISFVTDKTFRPPSFHHLILIGSPSSIITRIRCSYTSCKTNLKKFIKQEGAKKNLKRGQNRGKWQKWSGREKKRIRKLKNMISWFCKFLHVDRGWIKWLHVSFNIL